MFCFTTQCNQNKTFEKPCTRRHTRLWMSRNTGLYTCVQSFQKKPCISSHSKPCTRLLKCFALITLCCKTKHLRSLVGTIIQGFELLEILQGLRLCLSGSEFYGLFLLNLNLITRFRNLFRKLTFFFGFGDICRLQWITFFLWQEPKAKYS